ncbi:MAG: M23 family metallopeptidase [Nocardioides sp.]
MVGDQTRAYDELRAAEVLLRVRREQVRAARAAADRLGQRRAIAETQQLEQQAETAAASYAASVAERQSALGAARKAKAADLRKLRALKAEEDRIAAMLRRRAQQQHTQQQPTGPSGGYLSFPANGPVTSPYGYRIHPIYGYYGLHDGTDFGAACGSPLYAAADGTVIQSYWSSIYGNRLIVDFGVVKGVSLAAIYNHATRYTVGVGSHVSRGQVIGYVGSTGWSTGCHLHFTVMVNGHTVDPMTWL